MEKIITDYLATIALGESQSYKNITIFPLFSDKKHRPEYLMLK